ncbi:unnamed protein product [Effrenium voratum]|uniref:Protein kinase domain-containing protein n=1 Tax=Effrenium voratum TaxID=2562239 RepID=A0AA36NKK6_9DINO|nr:unnamed protein product [Effrenium voratum]
MAQPQTLQARYGKIHHSTSRPTPAVPRPPPVRTIQNVASFADFYDMGKEVMPSTHRYMKVNFATRKSNKQEVVVKVRFKPSCFRSRQDEKNWRQNTEFLLNLPDSLGVAHVYEVIEDPTAFYIVMEKVGGLDLFETLEQMRKIPVTTTREIMRQLLESLVFLHSHCAVHKDLKLENVMIDCGDALSKSSKSLSGANLQAVKVIDFDTVEAWSPANANAKDVVGTDQYIAQEAYAGKYSPLSDIFACGVILYRLLTGKFPFHDDMFDDEAGENWVGSPKMAQIRRRLKVAKVDFSKEVFQENSDACDLVMRMLAYQENQRPTASAALEHPWFQESKAAPPFPPDIQESLLRMASWLPR